METVFSVGSDPRLHNEDARPARMREWCVKCVYVLLNPWGKKEYHLRWNRVW
jgi:hypothetical protein